MSELLGDLTQYNAKIKFIMIEKKLMWHAYIEN